MSQNRVPRAKINRSNVSVVGQNWNYLFDIREVLKIVLVTNIDLFTCADGETRCWSSYSIITNELIRGCSSANLTETGCVTDNQNGMICRKSKIFEKYALVEFEP